jgi:hypothetical protein
MSLMLRVIALFLPASEREWMLGDIEEEFHATAQARGSAAARRWISSELARIATHALRTRIAGLPRTPE